MSSHLVWDLIKHNHCFLMKRGRERFSRDPLNLKGKNCFRYCGLVHKKAIGIKEEKYGKGVVVITKNVAKDHKPAKAVTRTKFVHGRRPTLKKIRNLTCKQKYRRELKMLALRRASSLMHNMKPAAQSAPKTKKT
ncbi:large subunit ribosomal protein L28e [Schistosoma bovis]|uniref:Large ribosomal subunit protein eL28 n=1 Tax=Schistosoma bovis TaxID=6184 RepID=A0A430Q4B8_SCHBO|nr:large subunit ribosomal protein L28e [Schistosoma bovis]